MWPKNWEPKSVMKEVTGSNHAEGGEGEGVEYLNFVGNKKMLEMCSSL